MLVITDTLGTQTFVESSLPPSPTLEHDGGGALLPEMQKGHGGENFEIGWSDPLEMTIRCLTVERFDNRPDRLDQRVELVCGALPAVECDSLFDVFQVGRGEKARPISGIREDGGEHCRSRAFAFGPGNVNDR